MKVKTIPSKWITAEGRRLDCGPFMSGVVEARMMLTQLSCRKDQLAEVCAPNGVFMPGRFRRVYVEDPEHGLPWLSPSDMLRADLSSLRYVSKVHTPALDVSRIRPGYILLTRSGTIGNIVYARPDMDGLIGSDDIIRIVADPDRILSGYLYGFLSSRLGRSLIQQNTYGAIIPHLEPHQIADLPVPRLGDEIEQAVHELIAAAAMLRSEASGILALNTRILMQELELPKLDHPSVEGFCTVTVNSATLDRRLDAPYHSSAALDAEAVLEAGRFPVLPLPAVVKRCYKPPIFRRLWVDEPSYGRQFVSGNTAYHLSPDEARFVSRKTPGFDDFVLQRGWVVFQAAGQIYGLFGKPLFVCGWLENCFCADDMYRLVPYSQEDGAFLYAFLRTPHGQVLLKRQACGNSIPRIWDPHMPRIKVPWPDSETRRTIAGPVILAHKKMEQARLQEKLAIRMVEQAIEGAV